MATRDGRWWPGHVAAAALATWLAGSAQAQEQSSQESEDGPPENAVPPQEQVIVLSTGTEPRILHAERPWYPRNAAGRGIESWVRLRFDVDQEGQVRNIQVVDSARSGGPYRGFERSAVRALKRWRFEPATVDGKAVSRAMTQVIDFTLSPSRGVSGPFRSLLEEAAAALAASDSAEAARVLEALDELDRRRGRTMLEHGLVAALEADVYLAEGDEREAARRLDRAATILANVDAPAAYHRVMRLSFSLHAARQDYRTALERYGALAEAEDALAADDPLHGDAEKIRALLAGEQPIVTEARLARCALCRDETYQFSRPLNRKRFTIQAEPGIVDRLRVRCGPDRVTVAWVENLAWTVESDSPDCELAVFGAPNGAFTLVELGGEAA